MKIRTITTGFNLDFPLREEQFRSIALFTNNCKRAFEDEGYAVQTVRVATQPWGEHSESREQIMGTVKELESLTHKYDIDYFSVGTTANPIQIPFVYDIIEKTSNGFCSSLISDNGQTDYEAARQTATLVKKTSRIGRDGFANLRFAALFNVKAGTPFFPAAYHEGPASFAIGLENSDLVYSAFSRSPNIIEARSCLKGILTEEYGKVERIAEQVSITEEVDYGGIDASIATSVNPDESIAYAFEKLGLGRFGEAGTLTVASLVTETLGELSIKKCGYCGLMLPILEDYGLAMRNNEEMFDMGNLLLYSAVCGTGLDTIPLPGDVSEKKLCSLLLDVASLSNKLDKPLSARLMPVPGRKSGEMTDYDFEYIVNSRILEL